MNRQLLVLVVLCKRVVALGRQRCNLRQADASVTGRHVRRQVAARFNVLQELPAHGDDLFMCDGILFLRKDRPDRGPQGVSTFHFLGKVADLVIVSDRVRHCAEKLGRRKRTVKLYTAIAGHRGRVPHQHVAGDMCGLSREQPCSFLNAHHFQIAMPLQIQAQPSEIRLGCLFFLTGLDSVMPPQFPDGPRHSRHQGVAFHPGSPHDHDRMTAKHGDPFMILGQALLDKCIQLTQSGFEDIVTAIDVVESAEEVLAGFGKRKCAGIPLRLMMPWCLGDHVHVGNTPLACNGHVLRREVVVVPGKRHRLGAKGFVDPFLHPVFVLSHRFNAVRPAFALDDLRNQRIAVAPLMRGNVVPRHLLQDVGSPTFLEMLRLLSHYEECTPDAHFRHDLGQPAWNIINMVFGRIVGVLCVKGQYHVHA